MRENPDCNLTLVNEMAKVYYKVAGTLTKYVLQNVDTYWAHQLRQKDLISNVEIDLFLDKVVNGKIGENIRLRLDEVMIGYTILDIFIRFSFTHEAEDLGLRAALEKIDTLAKEHNSPNTITEVHRDLMQNIAEEFDDFPTFKQHVYELQELDIC